MSSEYNLKWNLEIKVYATLFANEMERKKNPSLKFSVSGGVWQRLEC